MTHYFQKLGGPARGLSGIEPAAMELLSIDWPGNVREARNVIEAAILRTSLRKHARIEVGDFLEN